MNRYKVLYKEICYQAATVEAESPLDAAVLVRKWLEGIGPQQTPQADLIGIFNDESEHLPDEPIEVYEINEREEYLTDKPLITIAGVDSYESYEPILDKDEEEE